MRNVPDFTDRTVENWICGKPFTKVYSKGTKKKVYPCVCINCGEKRDITSSDLKCNRNLQCKICNNKVHSYKDDDLTGTKQGLLTIGEAFRKDERTYYHVKCDCGKSYDILRDNLIRKKYPNCKCHGSIVDVNKKYGLLQPLKRMEDGTWECKCDCENIVYVPPGELIGGNKQSCGCKKQANKVKTRKDNKSGIKGVFHDYKRSGKWIAYINKDGKRIHLGRFDTIGLAADARKKAEEEMFK